jgi:molecular chaperone HtpG
MITDERVHGLRIRVKNIQIDSTTIFDELFAAKNVSYARFNTWYIGEVHINASLLIPNARRDGFEDTEAWTKLKLELSNEICAGLAKQAYDLSKDRQKGIEKIEKDVASLASKSEKYALKGEDSDERYRLLSSNATLKAKISAALEGALPETQLRFKAQLSALETAKKRLSKGPESDQAETRKQLVEQILEQVLLVLQSYLEPELFTTVKRALKSKIK